MTVRGSAQDHHGQSTGLADRGASSARTGRPRPWLLFREGVAAALAQPVATIVAALITTGVCVAILATAGQSAAAEQRVLARIENAGARTIVFSDPLGEAGLVATGLDSIADLSNVEWIMALGPVNDVRNAALGSAGVPVPIRASYTDLPPIIKINHGRAAGVGEAIAGEAAIRALGLSDRTGGVTGTTYSGAVVGVFSADEPLVTFNNSLIFRAEPGPNQPVRSLYVVAESVNDVATLERAVPALLSMTDPVELVIDSPGELVDLQRVVSGELGASSRQLLLLVLSIGLLLITVTLYGATAARRRDYGRRRALGATRTAIIVLVLTQTVVAALTGAILGTVIGTAVIQALEGAQPAWSFTGGVAVLTLLAAIIAAVPPALAAATRDPVRIVRMP